VTGAPSTRRLLLVGDVRVRLATHDLAARRALIWLAPLPATDPEAGPDVWQVFALLDDARTLGSSPVSLAAQRLPVQGIIRAAPEAGGVQFRADLRREGRPTDGFVEEGERVLASRLAPLARPPLPQPAGMPPVGPPAAAPRAAPAVVELQRELGPVAVTGPIFAAEGIFSVSAGGDVVVTEGESENTITLPGGATVQYWDRQRNSVLELSAQRAVVFLDPGPLTQMARFDVAQVRGIYLEGDVTATDGQYTLRAPRMYYDVRQNRALLVDAVFWTFDERRGMPLYLRARTLRQEAANQFLATSATLTNTAFFDPDLSIGVSSVTLTRQPTPEGTRNHIDARDITLRAGGIPFFYWPRLRGDPDALPLRALGVDTSRGAGTSIQSAWNLYTLVGLEAPPGRDAEFIFDYYLDRGPALGLNYSWSGPDLVGNIFAYGLPHDSGRDLLVSGERRDPPQDTRGMIIGEHRQKLDRRWTLLAEGAYISDPTFVQAFFERMGKDDRREFTNAVQLRRTEENTYADIEARARLQDFLVNEYLIQTPGYTVDKFPEAMYYRTADDVLPRWPGLLTWTHEYRAGLMRLSFHEPTARQIGFGTPIRAQTFWGIGPDESPADVLRARGLTEDPVFRADTRHELAMPMRAGAVNITPFAVGRATAYDQDFDEFSAQMDEPYRLWGAVGVTFSTEMTRIDDSVSSRLLDLHRIRHIVRPSVTLWHAETTIDRVDLPVYDVEVEDISEGSALRFGLDQTWQTQRGGPGRWRSVDVFRLNSELVLSPGDVDRKSPIPRFFDFRPEYSNIGGTFGSVEAAWQVTEVFGLGGETVYDFEASQVARTSVGMTLQHFTMAQQPDFILSTELRYLGPQDQTYAILASRYNLTPKYAIAVVTTYDTDRRDFATFTAEFQRRFPNVILGVAVTHNNISNDTSFGLLFQPVGVDVATARLRGVGASAPAQRRIGIGQ
jgi:hypothetical protein